MNNIEEIKNNIKNCYEICDDLNKNEFRIDSNISLKNILKDDLIRFSYYILLDEPILNNEIKFINTVLDENINANEFEKNKKLKINKDIFTVTIPIVFKHFVICDTKKEYDKYINYKGPKSNLIYNTYELFGKYLISINNNKNTKNKLFLFLNNLTKFIKSYGLVSKEINLNEIKEIEENIKVENIEENEEETIEDLLKSLEELTGLNNVKKEINDLVNLIQINKMREEYGFKSSNVSKHMVFYGNPGTGKTTIARIISKIYKKLGILSKGQLVEVDRSGLVAGYVGQTAILTKKVIDKAKGGVLFIDEAYTLSRNGNESDFGFEAIDTLLKEMEDNRDDLVVIVAGYDEPMEEFLCSNPGLKSRFNKFIKFDNYNSEELIDILKKMCKKQDFKIQEKSINIIKEKFNELSKNKDFANARTARNIFEFAITNQASRLMNDKNKKITKEKLLILKAEDFKDYTI